MSLMLALIVAMAVVGAGLGIARARRAAAAGAALAHACRADPIRQAPARWAGLGLLLAGGLGVQFVEAVYPPLSRAALLELALPAGLALTVGIAVKLARAGTLLPQGVLGLLGVPALVYALTGGVNGAFDEAAGLVERVTVVEKIERVKRNNGRAHVLVLSTADALAAPFEMSVDEQLWRATQVGRERALLRRHPGRLGVPWALPSRDLQPVTDTR